MAKGRPGTLRRSKRSEATSSSYGQGLPDVSPLARQSRNRCHEIALGGVHVARRGSEVAVTQKTPDGLDVSASAQAGGPEEVPELVEPPRRLDAEP
jgi:hypothetical protein